MTAIDLMRDSFLPRQKSAVVFALALSDGADERDARDFQLREVEQKKGASSSAKGREKRTRKKIT